MTQDVELLLPPTVLLTRCGEKPRALRLPVEAFLTAFLIEATPTVMADGRSIGNGPIGGQTRRVQRPYRQLVDHALARD